jgi:hypothetical protein
MRMRHIVVALLTVPTLLHASVHSKSGAAVVFEGDLVFGNSFRENHEFSLGLKTYQGARLCLIRSINGFIYAILSVVIEDHKFCTRIQLDTRLCLTQSIYKWTNIPSGCCRISSQIYAKFSASTDDGTKFVIKLDSFLPVFIRDFKSSESLEYI